MTKEDFNQFLIKINCCILAMQKQNPKLRIGQCTFNIMHELYPELINTEIRGNLSTVDPYYSDKNLDNFWKLMEEKLID